MRGHVEDRVTAGLDHSRTRDPHEPEARPVGESGADQSRPVHISARFRSANENKRLTRVERRWFRRGQGSDLAGGDGRDSAAQAATPTMGYTLGVGGQVVNASVSNRALNPHNCP